MLRTRGKTGYGQDGGYGEEIDVIAAVALLFVQTWWLLSCCSGQNDDGGMFLVV